MQRLTEEGVHLLSQLLVPEQQLGFTSRGVQDELLCPLLLLLRLLLPFCSHKLNYIMQEAPGT